MNQSDPVTICYLHGVTTSPEAAKIRWAERLQSTIGLIGQPRPDERDIRLTTLTYRAVFDAELAPEEMPERIRGRVGPDAHTAFAVRRAAITSYLQPHLPYGPVGDSHPVHTVGDIASDLVSQVAPALRRQARRYERDERLRATVISRVLEQVPDSGHVVLIAHSLGSVVALDLIPRLSPAVRVSLVTVGSPLGRDGYFKHLRFTGDSSPLDRLRSWVNVYDAIDPVAGGRGLAKRFPLAHDIQVSFGDLGRLVSYHSIEYYLSLPIVAAAVAEAAFDISAPPEVGEITSSAQLDRGWDMDLLAAAYAHQVLRTCSPQKIKWRGRFDEARHIAVHRRIAQATAQQQQASAAQDHLATLMVPTPADLLDSAADHVRGSWSDSQLVPLAIGLHLSSPVQPFSVKIHPGHRLEALEQTLNRVRIPGGNLSDQEFAKNIAEAVKEAVRAVRGASGPPMGGYLVAAGAIVLAATGAGLLAAAPVGLAGAAAITSTLATFGPGGMVGGMMMLALGSSVGSALLGAGVVDATGQQERRMEAAQFVAAMTQMTPDRLESALVGWLACVRAQRASQLPTWADHIRTLIQQVRSEVVEEEGVQRSIESTELDSWTKKVEMLDRAITWLDQHFPAPGVEAVAASLRGNEITTVDEESIRLRLEAEASLASQTRQLASSD